MRAELAVFNTEQAAKGEPTLKVGIGIHSGPALCGIIGSPKTRQYTAMGDTVNTASRLCSIAKPDEILISRATRDAVGDRVELATLPPTEVKGKSKPLEVFGSRGRTQHRGACRQTPGSPRTAFALALPGYPPPPAG